MMTLLGQASPQGSLMGMFLPLIVIFVIFYFLLIRPQQKQQKKLQQTLAALRKGDQIVTRGGLLGKIHAIADNIITVELADNLRVRMTRDAIVSVTPGNE